MMFWNRLLIITLIIFVSLNSFHILDAAKQKREPLQHEPYTPSPEIPDHPSSIIDVVPGSDIPQALKNKWDQWSRIQVKVIDGRSKEPLSDAHVVIAETGQRFITDRDGFTSVALAPVIRDPRYDHEVLQRLHGQLTLISYKNGYRDTVYFNARMREGLLSSHEIWMYQITPEDRRIEPIVYHNPTNHLFILDLTNIFRDERQLGEGWQDPDR